MIKQEQEYFDIVIALNKVLKTSSGQKHAYSRYLYDDVIKSENEAPTVNSDESCKLIQKPCIFLRERNSP